MSGRISINEADVARVESLLSGIKNGAKKAITKAINKTVKTTKVQVRKGLSQVIALPAKRIGENIQTRNANYSDLAGAVIVAGKPIPVREFAKAQTSKGVRAKFYKSSTLRVIPGSFWATMRSGHKAVFVRKYRMYGSSDTGATNQPPTSQWLQPKPVVRNRQYGAFPHHYKFKIQELTGPRIEDILAKDSILLPIQNDAATLYQENLAYEIDDILRRSRL